MWHRTLATPRTYTVLENAAREAPLYVRLLGKPPYEISYAGLTYVVKPIVVEEENVSYITARMLSPTGKIWLPVYEHELSHRFPTREGAAAAWHDGFQANSLLFLPRQIIGRLLDEEAAEEVAPPALAARDDAGGV